MGQQSNDLLQGKHLLIDMYGVAEETLRDDHVLLQTINQAVAATGLHALTEPTIIRFTTRGEGVTGFVPLAESHIAFHSYPEFNYVAVDVFTCGATDTEAVSLVFEKALKPARMVSRLCHRGVPNPA